MNYPKDCLIFFNNVPTITQMADALKVEPYGISLVLKLSNELAIHYIDKLSDKSINQQGFAKAIAIKMLKDGIHHTVIKLDKLNTKPQSKFFYKKKIPYYSLLASDIKAKAEGRKEH